MKAMQLQVGVKALIANERGEYLFILRRAGLLDGSGIRWDIPGGRIGPDETLLQGLSREIREEVGLELDGEPSPVGTQDIFIASADLHVVRLTYVVKARGEVRLSVEHEKCMWASAETAKDLNVDNYLRLVLQKLL